METANGPYSVSFTPKGYLVNQMLADGWGWDAALEHAGQLFSADGSHPSFEVQSGQVAYGAAPLDLLQHVQAYIAACDQPPSTDDYLPRVEEMRCGGLEVRA